LVDSSESLVDRLLPLPANALKGKTEHEDKDQISFVYRVARLPFAVPLRVTMIMYVKANATVDTMVLCGRQVAGMAWEKQNQFAQQVMQRAKPLTDKVVSVTTPAMERVRAGKTSAGQKLANGRQMVTVRVNNMVVRLHLVEAKDWSVEKTSDIKTGTLNIFMAVVSVAHGTTTRVIGQQRATTLFTKLHLPIKFEQPEASASPQSALAEVKAEVKADAKPPSTIEFEQPKASTSPQSAKTEVEAEVRAEAKALSTKNEIKPQAFGGQLDTLLSPHNKLDATHAIKTAPVVARSALHNSQVEGAIAN
jgi:hypothetical protein